MAKYLATAIALIAITGTANAASTIRCDAGTKNCTIHSVESRESALRVGPAPKVAESKSVKAAQTPPSRDDDCPPYGDQHGNNK